MEMKTFKTMTVLSHDSRRGNLKVSVPVLTGGGIDASCLLKAVIECLGLKSSSQTLFALFDDLTTPKRRYLPKDIVPLDTTVSLQKWCFDSRNELQQMKEDEIASRLVFTQAQASIQAGLVKIDKEVEAKLEEYADENFTLEFEYVKTCHSLEGYPAYRFADCTLCHPIDIESLQAVDGSCITIILTLTGLQLILNTQNFPFLWGDVKSWQLHEKNNTVTMTFRTSNRESPLCAVTMTTERCLFLIDVINAFIHQILKCNPSGPKFYTSMVTKAEDGSTTWQNAMFNYRLPSR